MFFIPEFLVVWQHFWQNITKWTTNLTKHDFAMAWHVCSQIQIFCGSYSVTGKKFHSLGWSEESRDCVTVHTPRVIGVCMISKINVNYSYGVFHKWGTPIAVWLIRENPTKMGWFGGTPIYGNPLISEFVVQFWLPGGWTWLNMVFHHPAAKYFSTRSTSHNLLSAKCVYINIYIYTYDIYT